MIKDVFTPVENSPGQTNSDIETSGGLNSDGAQSTSVSTPQRSDSTATYYRKANYPSYAVDSVDIKSIKTGGILHKVL